MWKAIGGIFTICLVLGAVVGLFILIFGRGMFVGEDKAIRAAEIRGYSNVEVIDKDTFFVGLRGCDETDAARFTVTAINPIGKEVEFFICSGWFFKDSTLRTK